MRSGHRIHQNLKAFFLCVDLAQFLIQFVTDTKSKKMNSSVKIFSEAGHETEGDETVGWRSNVGSALTAYLPESLSLHLTDLEVKAEHVFVDLHLLLPVLYGFLQLQLPLLQRQHAAGLVVQQIPHTLDFYLHDVVLHQVFLMRNK